MTGTVFDIGYQRYTGEREGRKRSRLAVFKDGVRAALGFGRGGRAKILPFAFITILVGLALIMVLVMAAVERIGGPGAGAESNMPSHGDFYGIASIILFVFAALVGPELLSRDRREGTINLYLMRPLTGADYLFARYAAFLAVICVTAWLPQFIMFFGYWADAREPWIYFKAHWLDIPKFLLAGLAMGAYATSLSLLTASFTTRRAYASIFLVGLFIISTPFTVGLAMEMDNVTGQWISMFNLTNIPVHVNDVIFGEVSEITEEAPAAKLGATTLVAWYFLWTLTPMAILWQRYRRMTP
jgi:ABC-2 type transport system permease protein